MLRALLRFGQATQTFEQLFRQRRPERQLQPAVLVGGPRSIQLLLKLRSKTDP
jgi:hypothetical protein